MDEVNVGDVGLAWDPASRIVAMRFLRPRAEADEDMAEGCTRALGEWAGERPLSLLVDCGQLRNATAGWRASFAQFFRSRGYRDRVAWYTMTPLISMMVGMFVRASGIEGRGFPSEAEARAWLLAGTERNA